MNTDYSNLYKNQLSDLVLNNKKIIIFGTSILGLMCHDVLKCYGVEILGFCDNNIKKQKNVINGFKVHKATELVEHLDAVVVVAVYSESATTEITAQLNNIGIEITMNYSAFLWSYHIEVIQRKVDAEKYARAIYNRYAEDKFYINNVSLVITEKCTLQCEHCGVMIPYYECPKHHDWEQVIKSIQSLCEIVDGIETVAIIGGEPLLHPKLLQICQDVSGISNILKVTVTTNSTIMPRSETLNSFKNSLSYMTISDYGKLSVKMNQMTDTLDEEQIKYMVLEEDSEWSKQNMPIPHNRGSKKNNEIFKNCFWVKVAGKVMNGQYHLCDYSAAITPFGGISNNDEDYIDLLSETITTEDRKIKLMNLYNNNKALKLCDYCEIYGLPPTTRAKQANSKLKFEVYKNDES